MQKIIASLNRNFYRQIAPDFSATRQSPWQGWQELPKLIQGVDCPVILDLACGNGRLYDFLSSSLAKKTIDYLGIDDDSELLDIAKKQFPQAEFKQYDLLNDDRWATAATQKFDLICIFGLTHHLPQNQQIENILQTCQKLLKPTGFVVISNWQFATQTDRFQKNIFDCKKIITNKRIKLFDKLKMLYLLSGMKQGEYLLDWQRGSAVRYARHIDRSNMENIVKKTRLEIRQDFFADGKSGKLNHYFILSA